jgi:hypothetical protein
MTKNDLIENIRAAFKDVKLEDGIGLWEAQGLDNYAGQKEMETLRKRDERHDWSAIPFQDLQDCYSSLSFFDAKGMRFCLPQFLICDVYRDELYEELGVSAPDVIFTLSYKLDEEYQMKRFSLFDRGQIQCVINYLEYKKAEDFNDEISTTIEKWKLKLE